MRVTYVKNRGKSILHSGVLNGERNIQYLHGELKTSEVFYKKSP